MAHIQPRRSNPFFRAIRKVFVSGFVVFSFAAYALHERFGNPAGTAAVLPQVAATQPVQPTAAQQGAAPTAPPNPTATPVIVAAVPAARPTAAPAATTAPTAAPTVAPAATAAPTAVPTAQAQGQYADGEYSGPVTDAYYGDVQVKAVIQGGKLADVQFLEYPSDRRTSVRINNVAMPYLIDEAIQAQSANVDVISGATLTSEAFAQSLKSALDGARART